MTDRPALSEWEDIIMQYDDVVRAAVFGVSFGAQFAGHLIGDQWVQTSGQASGKGLTPGRRWPAVWCCAKHVGTWAVTVLVFLLVSGWWLHLPLRPGWLVAGMAVNVVTHFVADLRAPLIWLARCAGRGGYVAHAQVVRPSGAEATGPGTGLFHLDQAWHVAWIFVASLLIAGGA